jgi:hypothetical protein
MSAPLPARLDAQREMPPLSSSTSGMLAYVIRRVVDGTAEPRQVTTVLRRVCDESRERPPELLLLRIKELWTKAAGMPRAARDDRDRRYFALIGEALLLYFGSSSSDCDTMRAEASRGRFARSAF